MKLLNCAALAAVLALSICAPVRSAPTWVEGVNYFLIQPARPTSMPAGKVEVTEVFSYACPACNLFVPTMHKLKASLPPNAVFDVLPASFNPRENGPMVVNGKYRLQRESAGGNDQLVELVKWLVAKETK